MAQPSLFGKSAEQTPDEKRLENEVSFKRYFTQTIGKIMPADKFNVNVSSQLLNRVFAPFNIEMIISEAEIVRMIHGSAKANKEDLNKDYIKKDYIRQFAKEIVGKFTEQFPFTVECLRFEKPKLEVGFQKRGVVVRYSFWVDYHRMSLAEKILKEAFGFMKERNLPSEDFYDAIRKMLDDKGIVFEDVVSEDEQECEISVSSKFYAGEFNINTRVSVREAIMQLPQVERVEWDEHIIRIWFKEGVWL